MSFGGDEFPKLAAAMSGGLIAFYQIGYGVAAFGIGSLHDITGLPFSLLFSYEQCSCGGDGEYWLGF